MCLEVQCNLSQTRVAFRPSTEICKINYRRLADTSTNHSFAAVKPFRLCAAFHLRWPLSTSRQRYMARRMTFKPRHPDIYPTVSLLSYLLYFLSDKPQIQHGHGKKSDGLWSQSTRSYLSLYYRISVQPKALACFRQTVSDRSPLNPGFEPKWAYVAYMTMTLGR